MKKIINFIKDLISPKKCYSCQKEWHFLCLECFNKIWYFEDICYICKKSTKNFEIHAHCKNDNIFFDKIIVLTHYKNNLIKKLIKDAKFYFRKDIFFDLSFYLWNRFFSNVNYNKEDFIFIPSPMYFFKKIKRGYNQAEIIIKWLYEFYNINYDFKIVKKIKNTRQQSTLSRIERLSNLDWVFKVNKRRLEKYKGKIFVIVDDVISTWTTINKIAKILKENWIKRVYWLCLASD